MLFALEHESGKRRVGWLSVVGLVLIPLLVAGGFVWATWNSTEKLGSVQAAIVNNDEPVKIGDQLVPLGRQLSAGLIAGGDTDSGETEELAQNYDWVLSNDEDAAEGLESGRYAAVVTIPENFSAAATSYSNADPAKAEQATLDVQLSKITKVVDPALSQAIVSAARTAMNTQLTTTYLDNIYIGFNDLNKQFKTVADASGKLSDGAKDLSTGVDQLNDGAGALAKGLGQLSEGTKDLPTQVDQLATGAKGLADGAGQLSTGLDQSATGAGKLADGAHQSATGSKSLAKGAQGLADGTSDLAAGAKQLADGAAQLNKGVPALSSGATQLAAGASGLSTGLQAYQKALTAGQIPCEAATIPSGTPECEIFQAGVAAAAAGLSQSSPDGGPSLIDGARQLAQGANGLATGITGTAKTPGLADGIEGVASGSKELSSGTKQLASGASDLADGASQLSGGLGQLDKGTAQLADGLDQLAEGGTQLSTGAAQLSTGTRQLADGLPALAEGITQSADGADQLADGVDQLSGGASQLAKGTEQLHDGLAKGADQIPTYSESDRENLAKVVAAPVSPDDPKGSSVFSDVSAGAFIVMLALWLGGLATYLVVRAVSRSTLSSMRPSWLIALRGMAPGAAISVVPAVGLTFIMRSLLDLDTSQFFGILAVTLLAGVTFAVINHALAAALGGVGRFVAVIVAILTAAGALLSAMPEFFTAVQPLLPLTPAVEAVKSIASDGTGTGGQVGKLVAWLMGAAVVSLLAVVRQRTAKGQPVA